MLCVQVSLVFCSVFTLIMCTTLCILPFTLVALSWLKLAPSLRATVLYPRPGSLERPVSTLGSYLAVPPSSPIKTWGQEKLGTRPGVFPT